MSEKIYTQLTTEKSDLFKLLYRNCCLKAIPDFKAITDNSWRLNLKFPAPEISPERYCQLSQIWFQASEPTLIVRVYREKLD